MGAGCRRRLKSGECFFHPGHAEAVPAPLPAHKPRSSPEIPSQVPAVALRARPGLVEVGDSPRGTYRTPDRPTLHLFGRGRTAWPPPPGAGPRDSHLQGSRPARDTGVGFGPSWRRALRPLGCSPGGSRPLCLAGPSGAGHSPRAAAAQ